MRIDRWTDFALSSERDLANCRSWFAALVRPEDMILMAQGYETDDGDMPRIRVLVRRANGRLVEVTRNQNKRNWTMKCGPPSPGILKRATLRGINLEAAA